VNPSLEHQFVTLQNLVVNDPAGLLGCDTKEEVIIELQRILGSVLSTAEYLRLENEALMQKLRGNKDN